MKEKQQPHEGKLKKEVEEEHRKRNDLSWREERQQWKRTKVRDPKKAEQ